MNEESKKGDGKRKNPRKRKEVPSEIKHTRRQTGIRVLATLFFVIVVWSILETIVFLMVIFQIIHALIVEKPNLWLRGFANRTIAYFYRMMRYLTYNEERVPFPFSRFPAEIEK
ncbi:MAG: DUF4389 domain-containing protein [Proteobacteria bacterium]|nr:DUF4389 domain-containing protein [Pseudomonadota bacterium]